ncbi:hypothetical protein CROQUDRAFT_133210 [Cronartium quercuum f. sp. fusiforme G11]|uniref:Uncharacterized protein n=1 Tax=Cronartium quercuum f. sp. fusiforme G11 TaxID=708437 RepID=A0A9P6NII2_9BASI|nr:hypothetical protein CROQUDRAFT_133210 [Cronartium quercuum f. sp. fusiforme G11]
MKPAPMDVNDWEQVFAFSSDIRTRIFEFVEGATADSEALDNLDERGLSLVFEKGKNLAWNLLAQERDLFTMLKDPDRDIIEVKNKIQATTKSHEQWRNKDLPIFSSQWEKYKPFFKSKDFSSSANELADIKKEVLESLLRDLQKTTVEEEQEIQQTKKSKALAKDKDSQYILNKICVKLI